MGSVSVGLLKRGHLVLFRTPYEDKKRQWDGICHFVIKKTTAMSAQVHIRSNIGADTARNIVICIDLQPSISIGQAAQYLKIF